MVVVGCESGDRLVVEGWLGDRALLLGSYRMKFDKDFLIPLFGVFFLGATNGLSL